MTVELDGIVYGLQRLGGISTYWTQLVLGLARDMPDRLLIRLPRTPVGIDAPTIASIPVPQICDALPTRLARYAPCAGPKRGIFHSSYYRVGHAAGIRRVVTVYDFVYEQYRTGMPRHVHAAQKGHAIARADAILCISENTREDLHRLYPAIGRDRTFVTLLAYDTGRFHPEQGGGDADGDLRTILFVGQRGGYKRFDLAVAAVAGSPRHRLAIVGAALDDDEQTMIARQLGSRWAYLGRLDDAGLRAAYSRCDALIYPSDYEGFGLPLIEAMACGAPVIANRLSSLPEVGGDAAIYAEAQTGEAYAAAITRLDSADERARRIAAGLERVRNFSWDRMIAETRAVYDRL